MVNEMELRAEWIKSGAALEVDFRDWRISQQQVTIDELSERCYPSKVIMIWDTGHYVSESVYTHITELKKCLNEACDLMEDVRTEGYKPDCFTTIPWELALKQEKRRE